MLNTFIIPLIRDDLIERCLETLYKYTPLNFYVYLIDQTPHGIDMSLRERYPNLMIIRTPVTSTHKRGNLGFAKATNLGVQLVETPYMTFCNDDVEFINGGWWQGVMDTFEKVNQATPDKPCIGVNPASVKLPDWSVGRPHGDDFYIMPYKEQYSEEEYRWLIDEPHYVNDRLTIEPGTVIDGVTMYCSVLDVQKFLEVGLLDERFYPGGGEDYDYNCRCNMYGYRFVGTTLSYVFHHWSKTFASLRDVEEIKLLVDDELRWNNNNEKYGEGFDIWGVKDKNPDDLPPITLTPL